MDTKDSIKSYFNNNSINSFSENDFKNICSWLLLFSPNELLIISTIFSLIIAKNYSIDEQNVLGTFLNCIGNNLQLIAAQRQLEETAKTNYQNLSNNNKQSINNKSNNDNNKQSNNSKTNNDINISK